MGPMKVMAETNGAINAARVAPIRTTLAALILIRPRVPPQVVHHEQILIDLGTIEIIEAELPLCGRQVVDGGEDEEAAVDRVVGGVHLEEDDCGLAGEAVVEPVPSAPVGYTPLHCGLPDGCGARVVGYGVGYGDEEVGEVDAPEEVIIKIGGRHVYSSSFLDRVFRWGGGAGADAGGQ